MIPYASDVALSNYACAHILKAHRRRLQEPLYFLSPASVTRLATADPQSVTSAAGKDRVSNMAGFGFLRSSIGSQED